MSVEAIAAGLTQAITIAESLRHVAKKVKNAEVNGLLADLSLALADVKMQLADSQSENADLKTRIFEQNQEIQNLRNQLSQIETQKNQPPTNPWETHQQKDQIYKILLAMAQADGRQFEIQHLANIAGVSVSVAELLTSDMESWNLIYANYNMMMPTSFSIADDGRRALFQANLIE